MTTYSLLPKLKHIGAEIIDSQNEFVLYKHFDNKTVELSVALFHNKYKFQATSFLFPHLPTPNDVEYLNSLNESYSKVS